MKADIKIVDSSVKHIKGKENLIINEINTLQVVKEEHFAFQFLVKADHPFLCLLGKTKDIHWQGLQERIRFDILGQEDLFDMHFLGYVQNDDGSLVGDPILNEPSHYIEKGYQVIWVNGKIPHDFQDSKLPLEIKAYYSNGYDKEMVIADEKLEIDILDYVLTSAKEGEFYLDLWQHPSNWARAYQVPYFSDAHFVIIDHYIKELAELGQRVIDLIITDYPWAGQRCYEISENPSNLFEFNIVKVMKNKKGQLICDFSAMDRYIDTCKKHGIDEEINLFGILGNWDAKSFGNPVEGYQDPLRISFYDESEGCYDFIRTKAKLKEYLSQVFHHLIEKNLWEKVKVISDEPNNIELFQEAVELIESAVPEQKVHFKCAIHDQRFFDSYGENIQYLSLNTCEAVNNIEKLPQLKEEVQKRDGKLTWYSCCFPEDLNIFIKSPLIESRLTGWFTYYWDFSGFLRWAYAIWPVNPLTDITYKYPRWNAGDMFFVYPGKDLKPMSSVREKNFLFGIQDFNILKDLEKNGISKDAVMKELESLLGKKKDMQFVPERSVKLQYSLNPHDYSEWRNTMIKKYLQN